MPRDLVVSSDRDRQAEYQRQYRQRQREGARVVSIELTVEREENLISAGLLASGATDDRQAVAAAVANG